MANQEQLAMLKQGLVAWTKWRAKNPVARIDLSGAQLAGADLKDTDLSGANLTGVNLSKANLRGANLRVTTLNEAILWDANLISANLDGADLIEARLQGSDLRGAQFVGANLREADLRSSNLRRANVLGSKWLETKVGETNFASLDLSQAMDLENVEHISPSSISTDTFILSKGNILEVFLRGCGLSDWEIESVKLYNPDLTNEERNRVLYKIYDLQASQAVQISPLFISYSHTDEAFVNKMEVYLRKRGIRFWRDIHDMKAGRIEAQIDRGIRQNPIVLLILSDNSVKSDWVQHEVRTARSMEQETGRDVLCPVALDKNWRDNTWPKRIMEQVMEYKVLDFSAWQDDSKFDSEFRRLIDGLELFYKG